MKKEQEILDELLSNLRDADNVMQASKDEYERLVQAEILSG